LLAQALESGSHASDKMALIRAAQPLIDALRAQVAPELGNALLYFLGTAYRGHAELKVPAGMEGKSSAEIQEAFAKDVAGLVRLSVAEGQNKKPDFQKVYAQEKALLEKYGISSEGELGAGLHQLVAESSRQSRVSKMMKKSFESSEPLPAFDLPSETSTASHEDGKGLGEFENLMVLAFKGGDKQGIVNQAKAFIDAIRSQVSAELGDSFLAFLGSVYREGSTLKAPPELQGKPSSEVQAAFAKEAGALVKASIEEGSRQKPDYSKIQTQADQLLQKYGIDANSEMGQGYLKLLNQSHAEARRKNAPLPRFMLEGEAAPATAPKKPSLKVLDGGKTSSKSSEQSPPAKAALRDTKGSLQIPVKILSDLKNPAESNSKYMSTSEIHETLKSGGKVLMEAPQKEGGSETFRVVDKSGKTLGFADPAVVRPPLEKAGLVPSLKPGTVLTGSRSDVKLFMGMAEIKTVLQKGGTVLLEPSSHPDVPDVYKVVDKNGKALGLADPADIKPILDKAGFKAPEVKTETKPVVIPPADTLLKDNAPGKPRNGKISIEAGAEHGSLVVSTHEGEGYKPYNEDGAVVLQDAKGNFLGSMVLDGMGGMGGGDKASSIAGKSVADYVKTHSSEIDPAKPETAGKVLSDAMKVANDKINQDPNYAHSGTVAVGFIIVTKPNGEKVAVMAHVGDSGGFVVGKNGVVKHRTEDQSVVQGEWSEVLKKSPREQAAYLGIDTKGMNDAQVVEAVQKAIASGDHEMQMRTSPNAHYVAYDSNLGAGSKPNPKITVVPLAEGDRVVMFSDGVGDNHGTQEMADLASKGSAAEGQKAIMDSSLQKMKLLQDVENNHWSEIANGGRVEVTLPNGKKGWVAADAYYRPSANSSEFRPLGPTESRV
ncbi:MAG: protein phosphatase 2C domain-containing protein, partial [Deltaproteobacteria bacterium]|nr:protein phosphatase 2C domain-containing protein [Deltaproteobacteria bacterium]